MGSLLLWEKKGAFFIKIWPKFGQKRENFSSFWLTQGNKKVEISAKIGRKTTFVENFFKNIFSNLVGENILKFSVS